MRSLYTKSRNKLVPVLSYAPHYAASRILNLEVSGQLNGVAALPLGETTRYP
jgi:hypothetical protein